MAEPKSSRPRVPKAFISYSWDDDAHKDWVEALATRLRSQGGVNVTLDQWHLAPGDQLPAFMERAVRGNDFVIAICTPRFQKKSDKREGGVGYEGDIMTAFAFTGENKKKFIPVLRRGSWKQAAPTWLLGKVRINLSGDPYSESEYEELLKTLHSAREQAPPIGKRPNFGKMKVTQSNPNPEPAPTLAEPPTPQPPWSQSDTTSYIPRPTLEKRVVDLFQNQAGPRIVTLKAEGGMGKTRLARQCAAQMQVANLFPDGIHFVSLATTLPSEEAVAEAIGRNLGLPAEACLPAMVLEALKGRTTLLLLDNYESVDDPTSDPDQKVGRYLIRLVTEAHGLRLLVTGRSTIHAHDVEQIIDDLNEGMTLDESRDLFLARARLRWKPDRELTPAEEPELTRILTLTAQIPLAIELAAAWTGRLELKEIADGLKATPLGKQTGPPPRHLSSSIDTAHGRQTSLTRSLDWSYNLLGKTRGSAAQDLFATCGLFAHSFDEPTVTAVTGIANARNKLDDLCDVSLIRRESDNGSTRYRLHRFTRDYALSQLARSSKVEETQRRFVAHYARLVDENATDPNDRVRYSLLDKEWQNTLAAFSLAETLQDTASLLSMLTLGHFFQFRGLWSEAEFLYRQILAIVRSAHDKKNEGVILNNMGIVYRAQGRYEKASQAYEQSLEICREFNDRVGQGQTLNNMGNVYWAQGRYEKASQAYEQSLEICREFNDRVGQGQTLNNMGNVYWAQSRYELASKAFEQALEIKREFNDRVGQGQTLNNMGNVYWAQSRYELASKAFEQALEIKREFNDRVGQGQTLNNMGNVYWAQSRYELASHAYEQALKIQREFNDRVGQGNTLNNMGIVYRAQGRYELASHAYEQALKIQREFNDRVGQGKTLNNMGVVYQVQGRYELANQAYQQVLEICHEFNDRVGQVQTLVNLALLSEDQNDRSEAIRWARQAVTVLETTEATMVLEQARELLNRLETTAPG